jgi:hypothetical protein
MTKEQVTFKTSVKMDNHTKNTLETMKFLGYAKNQSEALKVMAAGWFSTLNAAEQEVVTKMNDTLETRDVIMQKQYPRKNN